MANSEPNFNIDTKSVQEDEWVIYLKILTGVFMFMLSSAADSCLGQNLLRIRFAYLTMLIHLKESN
jgi:hypothetical protein